MITRQSTRAGIHPGAAGTSARALPAFGRRFFSFVRVTVLLCLAVCALMASEHHGAVKFNGVAVPGATVTASQGDKKFVAITDQQGSYAFPDLPDGNWNIRVEMLCFEPLIEEVAVAPNAPSPEWNLKMLSLDAIKAAAAGTSSSAIAVSIEKNAPAAGQAAPATAPAANGDGQPPPTPSLTAAAKNNGKPQKYGKSKAPKATTVAANGGSFQRADVKASTDAAPAQNDGAAAPAADANQASDAFLINGSSNNAATSAFATSPAFGNMRKGFGARYNGALNFNLDNSLLDANTYSLSGQNTPKPYHNQFGGSLSFGGPLVIKHLLPYTRTSPNFFVGYQWQRARTAGTLAGLVPEAAERTGDFSQAVNQSGQPITIFDPMSGAQFPNNRIPQYRISPQSMALVRLYPQPNFPGNSLYNDQISATGVSDLDAVQARVNKIIDSKDNAYVQFAWKRTDTTTPSLFGFTDATHTAGFQATGNLSHRFNQRTFLSLAYSFSRSTTLLTPYFANRENISGDAGITGNNQEPQNWGPPSLSFTGGSGITQLSDGPQSFVLNQTSLLGQAGPQASGNLYWNHRSHNVSIGGDVRWQQFNYRNQQNARGSFGFTGSATQSVVNGVPVAGTGFDFADFLLGVPDNSAIAFGNADKYLREDVYDAYFADDWRMRAGFSLNWGMRWEYSAPITELYGRLVNLDISPGFTSAAPVLAYQPTGSLTGRQYPDSLIRPDKGGWEPRVGFAWHPILGSSMVIRGGYGIYRDTSVYQSIASRMMQQSPLSKSLNVANSLAPAGVVTPCGFTNCLANGFNASLSVTTNTFAVDPYFRVGYAQNWQVSIQRDLPSGMVMTATYLGIKGTRAQQQFLPNTYPSGAVNPCSTCLPGYQYLTSNGNSTRQAGALQLRRRLHAGFTATGTYTFSKSIDDASLGGKGQGSTVIAQNWLNLSAERALSSFDQRHLLNAALQYTSGMGLHGGALMSGWRGGLFKQWTVLSMITAGSGLPLTPVYGAETVGSVGLLTIRPNYTGAPVYAAKPGLFLNADAWSQPVSGQWGNAGRNSITGPSTFSLNASLQRSFVDNKFDLRFDVTNALNHVVFQSWNVNVVSPQFGLPTGANAMRAIQINVRWRFM